MIKTYERRCPDWREVKPIRLWAIVLTVLVFMSLFSGSPSHATDDETNVTDPAKLTPDTGRKDSEQCTWACLKWTNLCNVDPRGVYKCRRSCANFGEICE